MRKLESTRGLPFIGARQNESTSRPVGRAATAPRGSTTRSEPFLARRHRILHNHKAARVVLAGLMGVALATLPQVAGDASAVAASGRPHITARPNHVMVNTKVLLIGTGFAPNAKLALKECGSTTWIAPQNPCDRASINVTTDARGHFKRSFRAELCPRTAPWPGHPITEERCYVGDPTPAGVDVINLVGHVQIVVTYP